MKNFRQTGDAIYVVATATIKSGDLVVAGTLYGVAATDAAIGAVVALWNQGIFNLPKKTGAAWTVGQVIYYDTVAKVCQTVTDTNTVKIGVATPQIPGYAMPASGDTTGDVRLNPSFQ